MLHGQCVADMFDWGPVMSASSPTCGLKVLTLQKPESMTHVTPSRVSEVSAMFVATIILLVPAPDLPAQDNQNKGKLRMPRRSIFTPPDHGQTKTKKDVHPVAK